MKPSSPSRRRLLQALAAAPLAASVPSWAQASSGNRLLILVFLYGGNDGYNSWVPFADPLYYGLRPTIAVPRDAVLKITERHGFNPALGPLMPMWEARELALVQGIGGADTTQQHFRDIEMAFTASDGDDYYSDGWVTRALSSRPRSQSLDAIAFDTLDIRESDPMGPFRGDKLGVVQVHYAYELLAKRKLADCVVESNQRGRAQLEKAQSFPALGLRTPFPSDPFGQAMRATVELAALDRSLPVIHVTLDGLDGDKHHSVDTHWEQLKYHADALKRLAGGLAALRSGLQEIGRWDEALIATYDEFGRSPVENEEHGTHHGHANTHFVLGGRVKGGLYGEATPVVRVYRVGGPRPTIDTRRLWTTVIERWWGHPASGIFKGRHAPIDLLRA